MKTMIKYLCGLAVFALVTCSPQPALAVQNYLNIGVSDPSVNLYAATWRGFYIATGLISEAAITETPLLYVANSSSNTQSAKIFLSSFGDVTTSHTAIFSVYANPTCTTGTTVTPQSAQISSTKAQTSLMTAKSAPTCSANGTLLFQFVGSVSASITEPFFIKPGNSLLVTTTGQTISDKVFAEFFEGEE